MKKWNILILTILVAATSCYSELKAPPHDTTTEADDADGVTGEICNNDMDDDGDGLVDCRDTADCCDHESCVDRPVCQETPDADTDDDVPDEDAVPYEVCDDGRDNDGDGLVDCVDTKDCCDHEECTDHPACEEPPDADTEEDVVEDPVEDAVEDIPADMAEEDLAEEEPAPCTPVDGELILTWDEGSAWLFDHIRAECWVQGSFGTLDYWHDGDCDIFDLALGCTPHIPWDQIGGTADASDTLNHVISITLSYPACAKVWCLFVAFDVADPDGVPDSGDEFIVLQRYALADYNNITGTHVSNGTLTAASGTCDLSGEMDVDPEPPGPTDTGPGINYYGVMPNCP